MRRGRRRTAQLHGAWLAFWTSAGVLVVLIGLLAWDARTPNGADEIRPLILYCAAGIKAPVEAMAREYEEQYGVPVQLQYGGSQTLLANVEVSGRGDLYLPADDSYLQAAREKDLLAESLPLARMTPLLAVRKGNPKRIHSLRDILDGDIRLSQANPDAAAVGKRTREALRAGGWWDAWQKHVLVSKPTVNDVANDVALGAVDAGVIWDALARQMPALDTVSLPELSTVRAEVTIGVLRQSPQPTAALRFARYLAARDRGLQSFEHEGFTPVEGDRWAETPHLRLFAGAMLQPAIKDTLTAFAEREGVEVETTYKDRGLLVATMKTNRPTPDVYFAGDQSFMTQVKDLFLAPTVISSNPLGTGTVQSIAIGKSSDYKQLAARLVDAIRSQESRQRFESNGFHWRAPR